GKKKRRKGYQKLNGHRQYLTELWVEAILGKGEKFDASKSTAPAVKAYVAPVKKTRAAEATEAPAKKAPVKKAAAKKAAPAKAKAAPKKAAAKKAAPKKDDKK
ncbi:MAG: bL21 family ribosomal protein, partial [Bacteroidetes bacterium]|nr:bL21 family ribosomal protein [Bacteroidota bacterium]